MILLGEVFGWEGADILRKFLVFPIYKFAMDKKTTASLDHRVIGNYTLLSNEPLGKGATGTVYKGTLRST